MKRTLIVCIAIVFSGKLGAQTQPLQLYDTVPNMEFRMINYSSPTARISDFRGKLLILDFWSRWCSACVEQFPKIEAIQRQFPNEVMILPVGFEGRHLLWDNIEGFYKERKKEGRPINLPSAVQTRKADTLLRNLFPLNGVPMLVWINFRGKLVGITNHHPLNVETIQAHVDAQIKSKRLLKQREEKNK